MSKKILVVESDAPLAARIEAALQSRGVDVAIARDANAAIDAARAERPDGIVLCAELAGGSGFVVCNRIRKDAELREIPLLITSADATEATFEQHRRLKTRADGYVHKPFAVSDLVQQLGALAGLPGSEPRAALEDDDLLAFDAAFDSIAQMEGVAAPVEHPISAEDAAAAAAMLEGLPNVDEPIADFSAIGAVRDVATPAFEAELGARIDEEPEQTDAESAAGEELRAELSSLRRQLEAMRAERDAALAAKATADRALVAAQRQLEAASAQRDRTREALAAALAVLDGGDANDRR